MYWVQNDVGLYSRTKSTVICQKLTRGTSHNYYGEPAQFNGILYIFPLVIAAAVAITLGLAVGEPTNLGDLRSFIGRETLDTLVANKYCKTP